MSRECLQGLGLIIHPKLPPQRIPQVTSHHILEEVAAPTIIHSLAVVPEPVHITATDTAVKVIKKPTIVDAPKPVIKFEEISEPSFPQLSIHPLPVFQMPEMPDKIIIESSEDEDMEMPSIVLGEDDDSD